MPRKKKDPVAIHVLLPASLLAQIDARVQVLGTETSWPKITRSELIRETLAIAAQGWTT